MHWILLVHNFGLRVKLANFEISELWQLISESSATFTFPNKATEKSHLIFFRLARISTRQEFQL